MVESIQAKDFLPQNRIHIKSFIQCSYYTELETVAKRPLFNQEIVQHFTMNWSLTPGTNTVT